MRVSCFFVSVAISMMLGEYTSLGLVIELACNTFETDDVPDFAFHQLSKTMLFRLGVFLAFRFWETKDNRSAKACRSLTPSAPSPTASKAFLCLVVLAPSPLSLKASPPELAH
jgi:hypothetical protein